MTVRNSMKFEWIEDSEAEDFITDDLFVVEQKMDGTRGFAVLRYGEQPQMISKGTTPLKHTAATQHLGGIWEAMEKLMGSLRPGDEVVFDGEIMIHSGEYRLFDLPYAKIDGFQMIRPTDPFMRRRSVLEAVVGSWTLTRTGKVVPVAQVSGTLAKRRFLERCRLQGVEGVMFKHLYAPYLPGERVDTILKLKFVKTADVVVLAVNRPDPQHGSITFGAYGEDGVLREVGKCSAIGKPEVAVGDAIEVAYLYWTGSTTYQPRMMRVREDKEARDCFTSQFRPYSREVV